MATVFAVFSSSDNSLTFYNRNTVPSAGATFEGKTVTNVYTGFEAKTYANPTLVPWYSKSSSIGSVSFADEVAPTSLKFWFMNMNNLTSFDGKKLNTANVTTMQGAFQMCSALSEIDVSGWGSDKLTSTVNMFYSCAALSKIKLAGFVFSSVTNASQMFYGCPVQTLDLSSFDTSGLVTADSMFCYCGYLETIYVSDKWTMAAVTSSSYMFGECISLRGDIPYDAAKTDATYATYEGGYLTYKVFVPAEFQKDFLIRGETVFGIAEAIRAKTGTTAGLDPDEEMAAAIRGIETGVQLPVLTNPASAADIASGKEAIDGEGNVLTGTAESGSKTVSVTIDSAAMQYGYDIYAQYVGANGETTYQVIPAKTTGTAMTVPVLSGMIVAFMGASTVPIFSFNGASPKEATCIFPMVAGNMPAKIVYPVGNVTLVPMPF